MWQLLLLLLYLHNILEAACTMKDWDIYSDIVGLSSSVGISFWVAHGAFEFLFEWLRVHRLEFSEFPLF